MARSASKRPARSVPARPPARRSQRPTASAAKPLPPTRYEWREGPITIKNAKRANPQVLGEEFSRISARHGGILKNHMLVAEAEHRNSPLHSHFEWDNNVAGHRHRLSQANEMIRLLRAIEFTPDRGRVEGPAFVSLHVSGKTAYHPLASVMDNVDLQIKMLDQAHRDLDSFEKRYSEFIELCDIVRAARLKAEQLRARLERSDVRH